MKSMTHSCQTPAVPRASLSCNTVSLSTVNAESDQKNDEPTHVPHVFTALQNSL